MVGQGNLARAGDGAAAEQADVENLWWGERKGRERKGRPSLSVRPAAE
jgi:hypothetical protein